VSAAFLRDIAAWLAERPDPAVRTARRLSHEAEQLKHDALASGAMPCEFRVVHIFRSSRDGGMTTRLA